MKRIRLEDKKHITGTAFKQEGDLIFLLGESVNDINCSEYLYSYHDVKLSPAPHFDLDKEYLLQNTVKALIENDLIHSAHDCADGGLFVTLFESAKPNGLGFEIASDDSVRKDAFLFGEAQSRVVVSVPQEKQEQFIELLSASDIDFTMLGAVGGKDLIIDGENFGSIDELSDIYDNALKSYIEGKKFEK